VWLKSVGRLGSPQIEVHDDMTAIQRSGRMIVSQQKVHDLAWHHGREIPSRSLVAIEETPQPGPRVGVSPSQGVLGIQ
jgi:hypothetical protein